MQATTSTDVVQNALTTQIWTAFITRLLLLWIEGLVSWSCSMSNLVASLRLHLLMHRGLSAWLNNPFYDVPVAESEQLLIPL